MKLKELTLDDVKQIVKWRNQQMETLRTPFLLTEEMQEQFYRDVICNRQSNTRYWGLWNKNKDSYDYEKHKLIGMAGLENIQWENRLGEISLLLGKEYIEDNFEEALNLVLDQGFNCLNFENVYTELYECSHMHKSWIKAANKYNAKISILPNRKYYNGKYYDSEYINFNKERYSEK